MCRRFVWRRFVEKTFCRGDVLSRRHFVQYVRRISANIYILVSRYSYLGASVPGKLLVLPTTGGFRGTGRVRNKAMVLMRVSLFIFFEVIFSWCYHNSPPVPPSSISPKKLTNSEGRDPLQWHFNTLPFCDFNITCNMYKY
jgi:hypothetical protein